MKYNKGDKVRVRKDLELGKSYYMEDKSDFWPTVQGMVNMRGEVVTIKEVYSNYYYIEEKGFKWTDDMFEGKVSFSKSDLQNGDVIKRRKGDVEIVILPLGTLVTKDSYMTLLSTRDDLTDCSGDEDWDIVEVRRPKHKHECQFCAFEHEWGELVYKREEKPNYYNGKAVCIKSSLPSDLTVGKVYDFSENEGKGRNNKGGCILNKPRESLEDINAAFSSGIEFIQFVEAEKGV